MKVLDAPVIAVFSQQKGAAAEIVAPDMERRDCGIPKALTRMSSGSRRISVAPLALIFPRTLEDVSRMASLPPRVVDDGQPEKRQ